MGGVGKVASAFCVCFTVVSMAYYFLLVNLLRVVNQTPM